MKNILLILLILACYGVRAQDIHFSQFFEAPLLRNPALAGIFHGDIRVQAVYRDQWNSVTTAYRTASMNAEYKMPVGQSDDFITTGIQALHDRAGTVSWVSTHILPSINYHKSLGGTHNRYLSMGFTGGIVQRSFDRSKMTTNSQYDGLGDGEMVRPQYIYADAAAGLSYNAHLNANPDNNFYIGLSYHHFTRPRASFYRDGSVELPSKWVASGGLRFGMGDGFLTIQSDYSRQGSYREVIGGAMYGLRLGPYTGKPLYTLHGGAYLRWNDAIIPVLKIDYQPLSVSFSYDVNISTLRSSSYGRGGFELGISYSGFTSRSNSSLHAVNCPRF